MFESYGSYSYSGRSWKLLRRDRLVEKLSNTGYDLYNYTQILGVVTNNILQNFRPAREPVSPEAYKTSTSATRSYVLIGLSNP